MRGDEAGQHSAQERAHGVVQLLKLWRRDGRRRALLRRPFSAPSSTTTRCSTRAWLKQRRRARTGGYEGGRAAARHGGEEGAAGQGTAQGQGRGVRVPRTAHVDAGHSREKNRSESAAKGVLLRRPPPVPKSAEEEGTRGQGRGRGQERAVRAAARGQRPAQRVCKALLYVPSSRPRASSRAEGLCPRFSPRRASQPRLHGARSTCIAGSRGVQTAVRGQACAWPGDGVEVTPRRCRARS